MQRIGRPQKKSEPAAPPFGGDDIESLLSLPLADFHRVKWQLIAVSDCLF
jgi:hypothetical protein